MEGSKGRNAHTVTFRYRSEKSEIFGAPFILGRLDVFDEFNVQFREKEELVIFEFVG